LYRVFEHYSHDRRDGVDILCGTRVAKVYHGALQSMASEEDINKPVAHHV
jgi:hypothetical protein